MARTTLGVGLGVTFGFGVNLGVGLGVSLVFAVNFGVGLAGSLVFGVGLGFGFGVGTLKPDTAIRQQTATITVGFFTAGVIAVSSPPRKRAGLTMTSSILFLSSCRTTSS